jgi:hypothetical protein
MRTIVEPHELIENIFLGLLQCTEITNKDFFLALRNVFANNPDVLLELWGNEDVAKLIKKFDACFKLAKEIEGE